jgi:hypothetical protein
MPPSQQEQQQELAPVDHPDSPAAWEHVSADAASDVLHDATMTVPNLQLRAN